MENGKKEKDNDQNLLQSYQKKLALLEYENENLKEELETKAKNPCPGSNLFEAIDKLTSALGELMRKVDRIEKNAAVDQSQMTERIAKMEKLIIDGFSFQDERLKNLEEKLKEWYDWDDEPTVSEKHVAQKIENRESDISRERRKEWEIHEIEHHPDRKNSTTSDETTSSPGSSKKNDGTFEISDRRLIDGDDSEPGPSRSFPVQLNDDKFPANLVIFGGKRKGGLQSNAILIYNGFMWKYSRQIMHFPLSDHGVACIKDRIYTIGGMKTNMKPRAQIEQLYNFFWTNSHKDLQTGRSGICNTCVPFRGEIYVLGGKGVREKLRSVESFHFDRINCQAVVSLKRPLQEDRTEAAAVAVEDGIYVSGGYNAFGVLKTTEFYDPEMRNCINVPPMPEGRKGHCLVVYKGDLVVLGGNDSEQATSTVWRLITGQQWQNLPSMLEARSHFGAAVLGDKIIVTGGYGNTSTRLDKSTLPLSSVEIFDGNEWRWGAAMPLALALFPLVVFPEPHSKYVQLFLHGRN